MKLYSIDFKILPTNHIIIFANINRVKGKFLIDTGASNSCIDFSKSKKFKINFEISNEKASSASEKINETFYSKNNILEISDLIINDFEIILFDMNHINNSFKEKKMEAIDGIIGSDILKEFNTVINYEKRKLILKL